MSTNLYVYVGPFVIVPIKMTLESRNACPKPAGCPLPTLGFCPSCGIEASKRVRTVPMEEVDLRDLIEDELFSAYHASLGSTMVHYLIPNTSKWTRRRTTTSEHGEMDNLVTVIPADLVSEEIDRFCTAFADPLRRCKDALGGQDLDIQWGRIEYFM